MLIGCTHWQNSFTSSGGGSVSCTVFCANGLEILMYHIFCNTQSKMSCRILYQIMLKNEFFRFFAPWGGVLAKKGINRRIRIRSSPFKDDLHSRRRFSKKLYTAFLKNLKKRVFHCDQMRFGAIIKE